MRSILSQQSNTTLPKMADANQQSPPRQLGPAVSCCTVFIHFGIYTFDNFNFQFILMNGLKKDMPFLHLNDFFFPQQFLMSNKLETAMWLSRLFTVYCSIMFILPILGWVICNKGNSSFKIDSNMQAFIVISSTSDYVSVYLLLFSADLMQQPTFTSEPC